MPTIAERLRELFNGVFNTPQEMYQNAVRIHKNIYWISILTLLIAITADVVMSYMGFTIGVAMVTTSLIIVFGFYASSPTTFVSLFSAGMAWKSVSYDWSWKKLLEVMEEETKFSDIFPDIKLSDIAQQGWELYVQALKLPAHFLIIAISAGTIMELFRVQHPTQALVLFPALLGIGLWSFTLGGGAKWYRRITITVLVVGALVSFHQVFAEENPSPLNNIVSEAFYSKTLEFEVYSLSEEVIVCCVKPGTRKFSVPERQFVRLMNTSADAGVEINQHVRVNGARMEDEVEVADDGKVKMKFVGPPEFLGQPIYWQRLVLKFR